MEKLVKGQIDEQSGETKIYFDNLHLSLLKVKKKSFSFLLKEKSLNKIHVSFSMHGSDASELLLAEHTIIGFVLQIIYCRSSRCYLNPQTNTC